MFKSFVSRFAGAVAYFLFLLVTGSIGYVVIEGWPLRDALYMTAITISAVGYEEIRPLTADGRTFTMVLIFLGVTAIGLYLGLLTSFIVEIDLRNTLRQRRRMKRIEKLRDHVIVCGTGRTGRRVVRELMEAGRDFVAIEIDPDHAAQVREEAPDALVIEGDATHDQILIEAGIERAEGLVASLSSDADNVYVCLSARSMDPSMVIVARAYDDESVDKLYRSGATHVVSPNVTGALRMSSALLRPSVLTFLDVATRSPEVALRLEQAKVGAASALQGKTLRNARIREETGLMVIAVRKSAAGGEFVFNPLADTKLETGDEVIVLGEDDQIARLRRYAGDE